MKPKKSESGAMDSCWACEEKVEGGGTTKVECKYPYNSMRSGRKEKSKSSKRKLEKRLTFHAKVNAAIKLGANKAINKKKRLSRRQKKLKAYDLSALSDLLPDLEIPKQPAAATTAKLNCKSRQKLVQRESAQLRAVLNNPTFQMCPITAIQHHLELTQPTPTATTAVKEKRNKPGSAKRKRKTAVKGSSAGSQSSMDIQ